MRLRAIRARTPPGPSPRLGRHRERRTVGDLGRAVLVAMERVAATVTSLDSEIP